MQTSVVKPSKGWRFKSYSDRLTRPIAVTRLLARSLNTNDDDVDDDEDDGNDDDDAGFRWRTSEMK